MARRGPFRSHHSVILRLSCIAVAASGPRGVPIGSKRRSIIGIAVVGLVPTNLS